MLSSRLLPHIMPVAPGLFSLSWNVGTLGNARNGYCDVIPRSNSGLGESSRHWIERSLRRARTAACYDSER